MELNNLIEKFRNADNPIIYFGAGISTAAPSNIPIFSDLMRLYLNAINEPAGGIIEKHTKTLEEAMAIKNIICQLPIEDFFADVQFIFTRRALSPLGWISNRQPNQAHELIATLVKDLSINTILTPNFDCLLENLIPNYQVITDMKLFSKEPINSNQILMRKNKSKYLDSNLSAIFHFHGTSIESRIDVDITPFATSLSFDHFDHANLSSRLKDAVILFLGTSGDYDWDIVKLLRMCRLKNAIWISHNSDVDTEISENIPPKIWDKIFYGNRFTIKGNTTEILAKFANKKYKKEDFSNSEFYEEVKRFFDPYNDSWKLYTIATLISKISHKAIAPKYASVALSIIEELETIISKRERFARINEQSSSDLELTKDEWNIIIQRAKAIAMSRHLTNKYEEKKYSILDETLNALETLLKSRQFVEGRTQHLLSREWMLLNESIAIFHLEDGNPEEAMGQLEKAIPKCLDEEDAFRLERTKYIIGKEIESGSILNSEEQKKLDLLLNDSGG